jgi:hypothetical protein
MIVIVVVMKTCSSFEHPFLFVREPSATTYIRTSVADTGFELK